MLKGREREGEGKGKGVKEGKEKQLPLPRRGPECLARDFGEPGQKEKQLLLFLEQSPTHNANPLEVTKLYTLPTYPVISLEKPPRNVVPWYSLCRSIPPEKKATATISKQLLP